MNRLRLRLFILAFLSLWGISFLSAGEKNLKDKPSGEKTPAAAVTQDSEPEPTREGVAEPSQDSGQRPQEAGLTPIADYRILSGVFASSGDPGDPVELINPFLARKPRSFHGAIYEYHRNDFFDARNFFDPVGQDLPEFKRNQFGIALGTSLPLGLSVVGAFDGLRIVQGSTLLSHLPTPAMKTGDFGELDADLIDPSTGQAFAGNRIPAERIHPVSQNLLSLFPDPNNPDPDRNFVNSEPEVTNRNSLNFRVDQEINPDLQVYYRYSVVDENGFRASSLPSFGRYSEETDQDARVSVNRRFSHQLSSDLYVGFQRRTDARISANSGTNGLIQSLGIAGLSVDDPLDQGYPEFDISGYARLGDRGSSPSTSVQNWYSAGGAFNWIRKAHSLYFGGDIRTHQVNNDRTGGLRRGSFEFNGYYTGDAFADFLLGIPENARRGVGVNRSDIRGKRWELFFSDEWRITPSFRVSGRIRYYYIQPYRSVAGFASTFYPLLFEPVQGEIIEADSSRARQLGFDGSSASSLIKPDRNDWAPSVSFAYNPLGSNRLVIRSSYYSFYDAADADDYVELMTRNVPFYDLQVAQSSSDIPEIDLATPFADLIPVERTMRGIDPNLRTAMIHGWQVSLETRFAQHWDMRASYRGHRGTGLTRRLTANVPLPGPGLIQPRRPNPGYGTFSILSGGAASSENALNWNLRRRLVDGFSIESRFRWSKQLDDIFWGHASNPRDLRSERAVAGWTPAKQLDLRYILDLPFRGSWASRWVDGMLSGWRLSGITRIQDGRFFTVGMAGDPNNDGVFGDRPDRIGPGTVAAPTVDKWFEINDFSDPGEYEFGSAGRNILQGPSYQNWDISLSKRTTLADGHFLELRFEMFNAFNHPNFYRPASTFGTSVFGKIFGAARAREIEVALKYSF